MAGWLDRAAASGGLVHLLVYLEIAAGLAAVATILHFRRHRGTANAQKVDLFVIIIFCSTYYFIEYLFFI